MSANKDQLAFDQIASAFEITDPQDAVEFARVYARFEQIVDGLEDVTPEAADQIDVLTEAMDLIVMGECDDPSALLANIVDGVELLATLVSTGVSQVGNAEFKQTVESESEGNCEAKYAQNTIVEGVGSQNTTDERDGEGSGYKTDESSIESAGDINTALEKIAMDTMSADLDDLSKLGSIHTDLEDFSQRFQDAFPVSAKLAELLVGGVEKIILDECDAPEEAFDLLVRGIKTLQHLQLSVARGEGEVPDDPDLFYQVAALSGLDAEGLSDIHNVTQTEQAVDESVEGAVKGADCLPTQSTELLATDFSLVDPEIFADFSAEVEEHLDSAESLLLELESDPENKEDLDAIFRAFHTIKGAAGFLGLHEVVSVAHSVEDVLDAARRNELQLNSSIVDEALSSVDLLKGLLMAIENRLAGGEVALPQIGGFLEKIAAASGRGAEEARPNPMAESKGIPPEPVSESGVQTDTAPKEDLGTRAERQGKPIQSKQQFVRVGTQKLDQLVNMVGELVIAQTQVSQNPYMLRSNSEKLNKDLSQLVKISNDIQEIAMSMRMVPIKGTFERMARLVRDLARKCEKKVVFEMIGEDTELDKNVVEEIVDPLTHMVRNAVDHGIEMPEDRTANGKSDSGKITLEAYHKGGNIVIELHDNGKGLDRDKLLQKAIERGLADPSKDYTDEEVFGFIFLPGFSTAEQITDVSGRGVGMDVVRRNIQKLRGKVEATSKKGEGSAFTIRLPLTLAIIDGMIIGVGMERYILSLTSIISSIRPANEQMFKVMDREEMVKVQDELLPLTRLYRRFNILPHSKDPARGLVVIVEAEGKRCALLVDELIGMQQVVIKGLQDNLRQEKCFSGCAILGDGQVGLILDVNALVNESTEEKNASDTGYKVAS